VKFTDIKPDAQQVWLENETTAAFMAYVREEQRLLCDTAVASIRNNAHESATRAVGAYDALERIIRMATNLERK
jgi:hypothetical protein